MACKNPEDTKAYARAYYLRNIDKYRKYAADHREHKSQLDKARYIRDYDIIRAKRREEWRVQRQDPAVKEADRKRSKKDYLKYRAKISERSAKYYAEHREAILAKYKARRKSDPQFEAQKYARRRLRIEATVEGESTIADFINFVRKSKRIACYYCKVMVSGKTAHIDHVVALSRGGSHRPDNLCASCPKCNHTKSARTLTEWKPPTAQQILPI